MTLKEIADTLNCCLNDLTKIHENGIVFSDEDLYHLERIYDISCNFTDIDPETFFTEKEENYA